MISPLPLHTNYPQFSELTSFSQHLSLFLSLFHTHTHTPSSLFFKMFFLFIHLLYFFSEKESWGFNKLNTYSPLHISGFFPVQYYSFSELPALTAVSLNKVEYGHSLQTQNKIVSKCENYKNNREYICGMFTYCFGVI